MTFQATTPQLQTEREEDGPLVDALIARAFGPGRFAKTAERLREGNRYLPTLSFVAWLDGRVVGCVRMWPVRLGDVPAILLGPFAVDEACRNRGLGAALIERACGAAAAEGPGLIVLVGDPDYFVELGFAADPARAIRMPGPVDQRRVLIRALNGASTDGLSGLVTAAI